MNMISRDPQDRRFDRLRRKAVETGYNLGLVAREGRYDAALTIETMRIMDAALEWYGRSGQDLIRDEIQRGVDKAAQEAREREIRRGIDKATHEARRSSQVRRDTPSKRPKKKYSAWFLSDGRSFIGLNAQGDERLLRATKRGFPSGAMSFSSESAARSELSQIDRAGFWPLWVKKARPVHITWT